MNHKIIFFVTLIMLVGLKAFSLENINIVCFKRKSFFIESLKLKNIKYVSFDYPCSSYKIRGMIKNDTPFKTEKLNQEVYKYIRDNNLYK